MGNVRDILPEDANNTREPFKAYEAGFVHIDDVKCLTQMVDETQRHQLFVATNCARAGCLCSSGVRTPAGRHAFNALCVALSTEQRLTPPRRPKINGMRQRINSRIEELLCSHHFINGRDLAQTLCCRMVLYYHHPLMPCRHLLRQRGLIQRIVELINQHLAQHGVLLRAGTVGVATIIAAPDSNRNGSRQRNPEMRQPKKGNR